MVREREKKNGVGRDNNQINKLTIIHIGGGIFHVQNALSLEW